ncbi:cytochrome P450 [Hypoxylon cercidicola]|nr:cytochrome P450 [Hypoxylon cercidicola]
MLNAFLLVALPLLVVLVYEKLRYKRLVQYANFPQPPTSLLLGHLKVFDKFAKHGHSDRHPDTTFSEMHKSIGCPPLMLIDFRPMVSQPMVFVTNYGIAEQLSRSSKLFPTSVSKSKMGHLRHLTGPTSIVNVDGDNWKALRKRFNPGFAPEHLMTLIPRLLDKIMIFTKHLDTFAKTKSKFSLMSLIGNLTFDVIGVVVMDVDLKAQHLDSSQQGQLFQLYTRLSGTYWDEKANLPLWIAPGVEIKRRRLEKQIDAIIKSMIREKYAENQARRSDNKESRSILSLSLHGTKALSRELVDVTCDQVKTFLLAGHDTLSPTLAFVFYELSRTPRALAAVRAELDDLLGTNPEPEAVRARLLLPDGPDLINRMPYMAAVLKETLRLHPPAGTVRYSEPGTGLTVHTPAGEEYCLDGLAIYNCPSIIHRDPIVYGETADQFVPERWLDDHADNGFGSVPTGAWRPFERGPRNCIGQEFANIEARAIIALVIRRFVFTKVGLGRLDLDDDGRPILGKEGQYQVDSEVYKVRQITQKPADGMMVTVQVLP